MNAIGNSTISGYALLIANFKSYFVSAVVCSGTAFNLATLVVYNCDNRWSRSERVKHSVSAIGNLVLLIFRASINYWWGDGLYFSTGGKVYVYIDQINETSCKAIRVVSVLGELLGILAATFEVSEVAHGKFTQRLSESAFVLVYAVYFVIAGAISSVTSYISMEIGRHPTAISGSACAYNYQPYQNQVLITTMQTLMYAAPVCVMTVSVNLLVVMKYVKARNAGDSGWNAEAVCRSFCLTEEDLFASLKAFFYLLFLLPIYVSMCLRVEVLQQTGQDSNLIHNLLTIFVLLAYILPTIDVLLLLTGEKSFRSSFLYLIRCSCFSLSSQPVDERRPASVSVGTCTSEDLVSMN